MADLMNDSEKFKKYKEIDLKGEYPDDLRAYKENPRALEKYGIFVHPPTKLTYNEDIIRKSVEVDRIFPHHALYWGEKWIGLERGDGEYRHGENQTRVATSEEVQKNLVNYTSKCSPIIWCPGYFGQSEILTLLKANEMNPDFDISRNAIIEGSEMNAINFSRNLHDAINEYTGKPPERIDTYIRLCEESPIFLPEIRDRFRYPHAAHIVFGAINDLVHIIEPSDSKMLYILSKVVKMSDIILRSTQEFERLTDYEKDIQIRNMYDTQQIWGWLEEVPEKMGIKTQGKGIGRRWHFDDTLMAGIHRILYPNGEKPLTLACSEKSTKYFEEKKIIRSGLEEKFHVKKKSPVAIWGLRPADHLDLTPSEFRELKEYGKELIIKNPRKYGLTERDAEGGRKLSKSNFEKFTNDLLTLLRDINDREGIFKTGFTKIHKEIRTVADASSNSKSPSPQNGVYNLGGSRVVEANFGKELDYPSKFTFNFMARESRKEIYALKNIPSPKGNGKILVVEDDTIAAGPIIEYLRYAGFKVDSATNGKEALEFFERKERGKGIEAILLDIALPGKIQGRQILEKIKEIKEDCVVVGMSGNCPAEQILELGRLEMDGFLSKPFDLEEATVTLYSLIQEQREKNARKTANSDEQTN